MKRRLRKKRRLGEFRVDGFAVDFECPDEARDLVTDRVIALVESLGLKGVGYVLGGEDARQTVRAFLRSDPDVTAWRVGPLEDAYHGPFDEGDGPWEVSS